MADQSDVENELVTLVSAALYPNGTNADSGPGPLCRIYRGWPKATALNADLAAGRINVTVVPAGGAVRNTTRYPEQWITTPATPSLQAVVAGTVVSFQGDASLGQLAGVRVDNQAFAYRTVAADSTASVAANLAAMARAARIVTLSGATITFPGAGSLFARVVADAPGTMELRRQMQGFKVICWCPTPLLRDAVASIIDSMLAGIAFLTLPDSIAARVIYEATTTFDQSQDAILYRRDLTYSVEYATTVSGLQPSMLFGSLELNDENYIG